LEKSNLWIDSIVIDRSDFAKMVAFWQEALHYVPKYSPGEDWVLLKDPEGMGPNIGMSRSHEGPLNDYRIHVDLYSSDPDGEVKRLLALGATLKRSPKKGDDFITLANPDGNLFDVITDARSREPEPKKGA
jgi:hypothetical protein